MGTSRKRFVSKLPDFMDFVKAYNFKLECCRRSEGMDMPLLDDDRVHLFIILLLIPLQFLVWNYIHASQDDTDLIFRPSIYFKSNPFFVFNYLKNATAKIYRRGVAGISSLKLKDLFAFPISMRSSKPTLPPPSPPKIIELYERNHVFFGANQRIHQTRPLSLRFSIGQVVRHRLGFKAVVIGWDEFACAPASWMVLRYPRLERELEARRQPNYRLLADAKDTIFQLGPVYAAQDELEALSPEELKTETRDLYPHVAVIKHSIIPEFFDFFDGKKFSPRPWLRRIYPQG
ncbi:hypothetical protein EGR_07237 [Echinococcus granulosus]|uniref:Hemimethylated DNA-binding domain-containing protein n=2 Tax=Echinococcus granulosus TaxID=6210 RepID=W6UA16_ECHGR|nr:hypothetical protein EGR_07237 [Echinococcus granulosus]EUB57875.1 hypothetical protein EGR_07237 [Echinococcus granulosus]